jgi:antitoxin VapB
VARDWAWLDALIGPVDVDFDQAVREQPAGQGRPVLDFFE